MTYTPTGQPKAYLNDRKTIEAEPGSFEHGAFKPRSTRLAGKRGILVATGTAGAATATAVHQRNKRRQTVDKIFNPFTGETVEFGKTTATQRHVWDSRFGLPFQEKGKQSRKDFRRDYARKLPSRAGVGAGVGAGIGTAAGHKLGSKKVGAAVGGLVGADAGAITAQVQARNAQQRKFDSEGVKKAKSGAPEFGTAVRSVAPRTPSGKHVSHENKLYQHGKRKKQPKGDTRLRVYRGKGTSAMPEIKKSRFDVSKDFSTQQGAARMASRGTPLSTMANVGRHGRRIVGFEEQVVH